MSQNFKTFLNGTAGGVLGAVVVLTFGNTGLFGSSAPVDTFVTQSVSAPNMDSDGTQIDPSDGGDVADVVAGATCYDKNWTGPSSITVGGTGQYTCNDKCTINGTIIQGIADKIVAQNGNVTIVKNWKGAQQPGVQYALIKGNIPGTQMVNCDFNCGGTDLSCPQKVIVENPTCEVTDFLAINVNSNPGEINYNITNKNGGIAKLSCDLYKDGTLLKKDITAGGTKMNGTLSNLSSGRYAVQCAYDLPGLVGCNSHDEYIIGSFCQQIKIDDVAVDNSSYPISYPLGKAIAVSCINNKLPTILPVLDNQKPQGMKLLGNVTSNIHHITCGYTQGTKNLTCDAFIQGSTVCGDGYVGAGEECEAGATSACSNGKNCNTTSCKCEYFKTTDPQDVHTVAEPIKK